MVLIHVSTKTKEDAAGKFERTLRQVATDAHKMAGCLKYEWYHTPDVPEGYTIYGEFDSKENFDKYLNSSVVRRIEDELLPLLVAPPEFKHFEATILDGS